MAAPKWRPPTKVGVYDESLDTLHEGVPGWLTASIKNWLEPYLWSNGAPATRVIRGMEVANRWQLNPDDYEAIGQINALIGHGAEQAVNAIGYVLSRTGTGNAGLASVAALSQLLSDGGSVWEITRLDEMFVLTRRDLGLAKEAISEMKSYSERAHDFLVASWTAVASRSPDPNRAYDKAIKAVEVAAQPVILPNEPTATLGKINAAIRAKPTKWQTTPGTSMEVIVGMSDGIWTNHLRHGTDPRPRTDHTPEEADVALHVAIALVRLFAAGHVRPA
jgi:hypothetical protein